MNNVKRQIDKVIVHHSESEFGDAALIDGWHRERGFNGIGYHYVILNGCRAKGVYRKEDDGRIEAGRNIEEPGAHCEGHNATSIGICLIGVRHFSAKQLYETLPTLIRMIATVKDVEVYGHYEFTDKKTCPDIDMDVLRRVMKKGGQ